MGIVVPKAVGGMAPAAPGGRQTGGFSAELSKIIPQAAADTNQGDEDNPTLLLTHGNFNRPASKAKSMGPFITSTDSTTTLKDALRNLYLMPTNDVAKLQDRLVKAGVLQANKFKKGIVDQATSGAYEDMLSRAGSYYKAGARKSLDEIIDEAAAAPGMDDNDRPAFVGRLTNPEDIKSVINGLAPTLVGHSLDSKIVDQLTAQYQQQELAAQQQEYNLNYVDMKDGVVTQPMDVKTYAAQQARAQDPTGAGVLDLADQAGQFYGILGGTDFSNIGRGSQ